MCWLVPPQRGEGGARESTWPVVPGSSYCVRGAGERSWARGAPGHIGTWTTLPRSGDHKQSSRTATAATGSGQMVTSGKSEDRLFQTQSQRSSGSQKASQMPVRGGSSRGFQLRRAVSS